MTEHLRATPIGPCPTDLELASFIDGNVTTVARARIVTHVAGCDDCREVVATVAMSRQLRPSATVVPWYRRTAVWAGAAAVAASTLLVVQPYLPGGAASTRDWADLAAAVGSERTVEARVSGLMAYAPITSPTRSATPAAGSNLALLSVAERIREEAERDPSLAHRHAWGVAALLTGRAHEAVAVLRAAATTAEGNARVQSDLAAALLALAPTTQARDDWSGALRAADAAIAVDAALPAAWFNRALALEGLGRRADAQQAWRDYATRFPQDAGWRDEALRRAGGPPGAAP